MEIRIKRLSLCALFVAMGIILPLVFHLTGIPSAGQVFLPMHIPVLLCALVPGPYYGAVCGLICPLASFMLTGMPDAARLGFMLIELAAYGIAAGLLYRTARLCVCRWGVYPALVGAMVAGRAAYALSLSAAAGLFGMQGVGPYMAISAAVTGTAGIIIQLVVIPPAVLLAESSAALRAVIPGLPPLAAARRKLEKRSFSLVVADRRGRIVYTSHEKGIRPLLECTEKYGDRIRGAAVADRVTGRAAALLCAGAGVSALYSHVLSEPAEHVLKEHGISYVCDIVSPNIKNRAGDGICPMEECTLEINDPSEARAAICRRLSELSGTANT